MKATRLIGFLLLSLFTFHFSLLSAQQDSIPAIPADTIVSELPESPADTLSNAKPKKPKRPLEEIYQGTILKLDLGSTAIALATSAGKIQHYELAVNCRIIQRLYPTFELGYAGGAKVFNDTISYRGHGGFFRVGLDINPLKKHPESPHSLLVGVRLGTAVQQIAQSNLSTTTYAHNGVVADCWGEIVAGCQVEIAKVGKTAFYMGWMGRFKFLFTRQPDGLSAADCWPIYIPGFGRRDDIGWGASYHLGWRF